MGRYLDLLEPTIKLVPVPVICMHTGAPAWGTDIFISDRGRTYYSRVNWPVSDTLMSRAAHIEAFKKRQQQELV